MPTSYPTLSDSELVHRIEKLSLHRIPLAQHLGARITGLDEDGLTVAAPLAPNRNHMGTGFAGSLASVATLAGWATALAEAGAAPGLHVVAQGLAMEFLRPVDGDFEAWCRRPERPVVERMLRQLSARGRARLQLEVIVRQSGVDAATLTGRFVLKKDAPD